MLLVFDGMNIIYRGYFASPKTFHKRFPTNGIRASIGIMLSVIRAYKPTHVAVVFDSQLPNFRHRLYPEYKGTRDKDNEDVKNIRKQIQPLRDILQASGIRVIRWGGEEGDDIIGSISSQYSLHLKKKVIIESMDKDFGQLLVDKRIRLSRRGDLYDHKNIENVLGVKPKHIVDYLSLMDDKVDNIKGVSKVGPKTAAKWLNDFNDIETIVANVHKGVVGANLQKAWANGSLALNRKLVKIKTDIPRAVDYDFNRLKIAKPNHEQVSKLCKQYGLQGLTSQIMTELK